MRAALLVDETDRIILQFRPDRATPALRGDDPIPLADVLPGFEATVSQVFDTLKLE